MKSVKEAAEAYHDEHGICGECGSRDVKSAFLAGHAHAISEFSVFEARSVYIPESNDLGDFILNAYVLKPSEDFVKNHGEFIQYIELLPFSAMLAKKDAEIARLKEVENQFQKTRLVGTEAQAQRIEELKARLAEAEKVIAKYADADNFTINALFDDEIDQEDFQILEQFDSTENELGEAARAYQKESAK